jgi:peptidoglycan hydrolase-like protein with peptidoglycan-binding domain
MSLSKTSIRIIATLGSALVGLLVFAGAAFAALGDRELRQGMSGDDVMELQRDVTYLGYPTPRYGRFTSRTKTDIINYERVTGLHVDGVVSQSEGRTIARRTAEKRAREAGTATDSSESHPFASRVLRQGLSGDDVLTLQRLVTKLGYPTPRYGRFTSRTKADYTHYEQVTGLHVDGVASISEQRTIARRASGGSAPSSPEHDHVFPILGPHDYGGAGSRYGAPRGDHIHGGQDVSAAEGTPLVAVTNGSISYRQYQAGGGGNYVVMQGDDDYDYVYMHLRDPALVGPGTRVRVGQRIGYVGSTGHSSGPHLHFEMWTAHWFDGGHRFDPLPYLQRWDAYS